MVEQETGMEDEAEVTAPEAAEEPEQQESPADKERSLQEIGKERLQRGFKRASDTKDRVSSWFSKLATRAIEGAKRMGTGTVEAGKRGVAGVAEAGRAVGRGATEAGRSVVTGATEASKAVGHGVAEAGRTVGRGAEKAAYTTLATPEMAAMAAQYAGKRGTEAVKAVRGAVERGKEMGASAWEAGEAFAIQKKDNLVKRSREAYGRLSNNVSEARKWGVDKKNGIIEAHRTRQEARAAERKAAEVAKLELRVKQLREEMSSITELLSKMGAPA